MQSPELTANQLVMADGSRLPLRVWRPEGDPSAVILAVHGINDYSQAFDAAARSWASQGIQTYAYDQRGFGGAPGHGLWPGTETLVSDLNAAKELLRGAHAGKQLFLVGTSMGGAVVMTAMGAKDAPQVDGIVLAAPAVWGWQTLNPFYKAVLWIGAHVAPGAKVSGRGLGFKPSDNRDMLIALGKDPLIIKQTRIDSVYGLVNLMDAAFSTAPDISVPTLVIYGAKEEIVPKIPTFKMLRRLTAPHRVAIYPDGYHMLLRDLKGDVVHADIAAWITSPTAPLPSGNDMGWQKFFSDE